jgi:hypothetical protein
MSACHGSPSLLVTHYPLLECHSHHIPAQTGYTLGISTAYVQSHHITLTTQPSHACFYTTKFDFGFHGLGPSRSRLLTTTLLETRRHKLECPTRSIFTLILEHSMRVPEQVQRKASLLEPNLVVH